MLAGCRIATSVKRIFAVMLLHHHCLQTDTREKRIPDGLHPAITLVQKDMATNRLKASFRIPQRATTYNTKTNLLVPKDGGALKDRIREEVGAKQGVLID